MPCSPDTICPAAERITISVSVLADSPDTGHLLAVQLSEFQGLEVFVQLRHGGGAGQADVHVGVGENETVAVGRGQRALAFRHELGFEEFAPAGRGEDQDARSILIRQVRKDVLLGPRVHGVIPDLKVVVMLQIISLMSLKSLHLMSILIITNLLGKKIEE